MATATPRDHCARRAGHPLRVAICLTGLFCGTFLPVGCRTTPPVTYPGRFLRHEAVRTEHSPSLRCRLLPAAGSTPRLQFLRLDLVTHHEVPVHEKILVWEDSNQEDPSKIARQLVPDEFVKGKVTTRSETVDYGPWANQVFEVNDMELHSDADGVATDETHSLLDSFDDLSRQELRLRIAHARTDPIVFTVTRRDLITTLGAVWDAPAQKPDRGGLQSVLEYPDQVVAGTTVEVALTVLHTGARASSMIMARSCSRHEWLRLRTFYIGVLQPGEERRVVRRFHVPKNHAGGVVYAGVGLWDFHQGPMPDLLQPLHLTVQGPATP